MFAAFRQDAIDNQALLAKSKLTIPMLAIGGETSYGARLAVEIGFAAEHVQSRVIADAGHWLAEEQPAATIAAVRKFLAQTPRCRLDPFPHLEDRHGQRLPYFVYENRQDLCRLDRTGIADFMNLAARKKGSLSRHKRERLFTVRLNEDRTGEHIVEFVPRMRVAGGDGAGRKSRHRKPATRP